MRVAIMQPYLFPYWPYVQLMGCVDRFLILDTVQYIDRGWVNRNCICLQGACHFITFPVRNAAKRLSIKDASFSAEFPRSVARIRKTLAHAYGRRPFSEAALSLFDATIRDPHETSVVDVVQRSLEQIRKRLLLRCEILRASSYGPRTEADPQKYIMQLAKLAGAHSYVNPIGGQALYDRSAFLTAGIELFFLRGILKPYDQGSDEFVPGLSVLDLVANLDPGELDQRLTHFELL